MDYERGLRELKNMLSGTNWEQEFRIYEARLRENLRQERRYGSTEQIRAERTQIVDQLNLLAAEARPGTSFNDLCLFGNSSNSQIPPKSNAGSGTSTQGQPTSGKSASQRTQAYISFSTQDNAYLNELHTTLNQFKGQGLDYWDRSKMLPGVNQNDTINAALNSTKVAILLVSSDFLAAESPDFIATHELPTLLAAAKKQEVTLFPVIVRPCAIEYSNLKSFNPVNSRPLSRMSRDDREEFWKQVAIQVLNLLR